MITYSGRSVWPVNSSQEGVRTDVSPTLEDIAVGLGRQSRFAGQTALFYTVLCHSLVSADVAAKLMPDRPTLRLHLLLHDAHEAVLGDTPTTWKNEQTRRDEHELDERIASELGLPQLAEADRLFLHDIDFACLQAEAHALGHAEAETWWPRDDFGAAETLAFDLTVRQLQAGNPVRYLEPRNSIAALKRALKGLL